MGPKQAHHAREDEPPNLHQPKRRSIPPPSSIHDDQTNDPRYASKQNRTRTSRPQTTSMLRWLPTTIRHPEEIQSLPGRKVASLGRLCHEVGWQYRDVVGRLEAKRIANAQEWYNKKQAKAKAHAAKVAKADTAAVDAQLAEMGY